MLLLVLMFFAIAGCARHQVQPVVSVDSAAAEFPVSESIPTPVVGDAKPPESLEKKKPLDHDLQDEQQVERSAFPPEPVVVVERDLVLPAVSFVDQRIKVYADKLSAWQAVTLRVAELDLSDKMPPRWQECFAAIDGLSRDYGIVMETLLRQDHPSVRTEPSVIDSWRLTLEDIAFLEGGCDQTFVAGEALLGSWDDRHLDTEVKNNEAIVTQYVNEARYEDAIVAFRNLKDSQPGMAVSPNARKMYGLALLRTGRFKMAAEALSGALGNLRPSPEERALRRLVADLLLASGSFEEARGHYRRLADYFASRRGDESWVADQLALLGGVDLHAPEFPLYMEVLKRYISFDGRHLPQGMQGLVEIMERDFRESPLSDRARLMLVQLEDSIREWGSGRLDEIDVLVANDDYGKAKSLLEQMLFDDLPLPVHDSVQHSLDNLLQAEVGYQEEQRVSLGKSLSEHWDKAVWLLDSEKYDEAIAIFETLFNTAYDVPARANISKAAEAASVEMTEKSAKLYAQARNEKDHGRKKVLLRESWQLLHDITVKYPGYKLIDKVRQYLASIEKHIEIFDPIMLQELGEVPGLAPKKPL
jgi:tetratricopeptide (TPR) repeat protein